MTGIFYLSNGFFMVTEDHSAELHQYHCDHFDMSTNGRHGGVAPELHQSHCDDFDCVPFKSPLSLFVPELHQSHCDDFDLGARAVNEGQQGPELHQSHCDDFDESIWQILS